MILKVNYIINFNVKKRRNTISSLPSRIKLIVLKIKYLKDIKFQKSQIRLVNDYILVCKLLNEILHKNFAEF